jgi:hypothetical protein
MKEILFKALKKGRWAPYSEFHWPLRKWIKAEGEMKVCQNGIHLCTKDNVIEWLNEEIWEVEARGERIEDGNKIVVQEARLGRKVKTWNEKTARLFACEVARRVLPVYEKYYPKDHRPRKAIEAAEKYLQGSITEKELFAAKAAAEAAAEGAAEDAAWDAAEGAAGAAASSAAKDAAGAAARAAVKNVARDAVWGAARAAARAAAENAAEDIAENVTRAAVWDTAWDAERKWQTKKLMEYLYPMLR